MRSSRQALGAGGRPAPQHGGPGEPPVARARPAEGPGPSLPAGVTAALAAALALAGLGVVLLHPYATRGFRYPLGWDAPFYVWRAAAVPVDGLERVGTIRAALPLLLSSLSAVTGRDPFTLVAVVPAVLASVAGLGAAGVLRASFGLPARWVPVAAFLCWAGFGSNEIPLHHLDNLLNAALVLAALASLLWVARGSRGAGAGFLLLAAAGVAHWPFYGFALGVLGLGTVLWWWRSGPGPARSGPPVRVLAAFAASVAVVGPTLLVPPPGGWVGARPGPLRALLHERIRARLDDPHRFYGLALGAAGGLRWRFGASRGSGAPDPGGVAGGGAGGARALLGWVLLAWAALTGAAVAAQAAGLPTAGARVLSYFFPATLLATLATWWAARWVGERWRGVAGAVAAAAVAGTAVGGFGWLLWQSWDRRHPWFEERAVRQVAAAGAYLGRVATRGPVVFVLDLRGRDDPHTLGRWWLVVKASLPPEEVARARRYVGSPADYLARRPSRTLGEGLPPGESDRADSDLWAPDAVALVLERYNPRGFAEARARFPERVVAPGLLVLRGPLPGWPLPQVPPPAGDTRARSLVWVGAAAALVLAAVGSGWALALLPTDPVSRVALAPALGAAPGVLLGLGWERAGLPTGGWAMAGPLALAAVLGWVAAGSMGRHAGATGGAARPVGPGRKEPGPPQLRAPRSQGPAPPLQEST